MVGVQHINPQCHHVRGGVLFEVMLALALFVGAAAFTLACVRNVQLTLERTRLRQEAVDLARSRMAELEAGLTTVGGLRGETDGGSEDEREFESGSQRPTWRIEVVTTRSPYPNLTLVELTVTQNLQEGTGSAAYSPMQFTLRQLVELRADDGEAFESDPALSGSEGR